MRSPSSSRSLDRTRNSTPSGTCGMLTSSFGLRRRAKRATARLDRDGAQAFRTLLGGGVGRGLAAPCARHYGVHWYDHEEVNRGGDHDKRDQRIDEVAYEIG